MVLLLDNLFIDIIDVDLQERIANIDAMDKDAETALLLLLNGKLLMIGHWKNMATAISFSIEKRIIFLETTSGKDILKDFHDHETAGHPGELQTYNTVRQHYWWPGLRTFMKNYVQECGTCQQFKINQTPQNPHFYPQKALNQPDFSLTVQWT